MSRAGPEIAEHGVAVAEWVAVVETIAPASEFSHGD